MWSFCGTMFNILWYMSKYNPYPLLEAILSDILYNSIFTGIIVFWILNSRAALNKKFCFPKQHFIRRTIFLTSFFKNCFYLRHYFIMTKIISSNKMLLWKTYFLILCCSWVSNSKYYDTSENTNWKYIRKISSDNQYNLGLYFHRYHNK